MEKQIICTVCPQGCRITVAGEGKNITSVTGHTCPRGETYARQEFVCPMRILTGSVRTENAAEVLLPVRSADRIPRDLIPECMKLLRGVKVTPPVKVRDVVVKNILGTGVDIVASGELNNPPTPGKAEFGSDKR